MSLFVLVLVFVLAFAFVLAFVLVLPRLHHPIHLGSISEMRRVCPMFSD
jgi:hypothetical protein